MVVPPLPTLLTDATPEVPSDEGPLFGTILGNQLNDLVVFLFFWGEKRNRLITVTV